MKTIKIELTLQVPDDHICNEPEWDLEDAFDPRSKISIESAKYIEDHETRNKS